jgi:hypothetical protein
MLFWDALCMGKVRPVNTMYKDRRLMRFRFLTARLQDPCAGALQWRFEGRLYFC